MKLLQISEEDEAILDATVHINLPDTRQTHPYDCGPNCLRAICSYYGIGPEDENSYIEMCKAKPDGAHPRDIVKAARSVGLNAEFYDEFTVEELKWCIEQGRPVICEIQAWGKPENYHKLKDGHYVIAIGFDADHIFFEEPSILASRGYLTWDEFDDRWEELETNGDHFRRSAIVIWREGRPVSERVLGRAKHID